MARWLPWLLLALLLGLAPGPGHASAAVEAWLREADAVRSSDPDRFDALLERMRASSAATARQREQLAYLEAYALSYAGRYDESIANLRTLVATATDGDVRLRASALLVNSYAVTRQFTEGLRTLEGLLSRLDDARDPDIRIQLRAVAAVLYNHVGQHKLALHYADQILAGVTPRRARCFAGQYRVEALQELGALSREDTELRRLVALCNAEEEHIVANMVRLHLARKWADEGQHGRAIEFIRAHLAEAEATRYAALVGQVHAMLAEYLLLEGDQAGAGRHARAAVERRASLRYSRTLVSAYRTLYQLAERGGDPAQALLHYRRYAEADKAYLGEVKTREMAYQMVRQETLQQGQQIELLNRRNELLQLQQRVDKQAAQSSRLLALLLVLLVGSVGYWAYKIKRVQVSLRRMAEVDALTGICNRRHFSHQSNQALLRCARAGEEVAVIMFDLDHFKSINDRFGHVTGDWVLRRVAETCKTLCRRIDHIGRIGGEEFAILLSGCDLRAAVRVADDCRVRIASIDTEPSGHAFVVTASFGVSSTSLSGYDLAKLLSHADMMLYKAKREGRNRVCAFDGKLAIDTPGPHGSIEPVPRRSGPVLTDVSKA